MNPSVIRLLIVDDSPEDQAVYRHWLRRSLGEGIAISSVETGYGGLGLAQTLTPDCVLLDFRLPDITGIDWLVAYHQLQGRHAPVIMLTGHADEQLALQAIRAGADDYLQKHEVTPARLSFAVQRAVEHARLRRARDETSALLNAVLTAAPMGVSFFDTELRLWHMNPQFAAINGLSPDEHYGRSAHDLLPDRGAVSILTLTEVLTTGQPVLNLQFQEPAALPGRGRYWQFNYFPVRTSESHLMGVGVVSVDVTDRVEAEATLTRFAARTALVADVTEIFAGAYLDPAAIFTKLAEILALQGGCNCSIWRPSQDGVAPQMVALSMEASPSPFASTPSPAAEVAVGAAMAALHRPTYLCATAAPASELLPLAQLLGVSDLFALPITANEQRFGLVLLERHQSGRSFTPDELSIATEIVSRAALSLSNAFSLEQVRQAEAALRQANDTLEASVAKRTAALIAREEELHVALAEKEVLLKEVHHRVKNNLQVIISLLRLQSRRGVDPAAAAHLRDMQHRVRAMSLVHEQLYTHDAFGRIGLADYTRQLATGLLRSYIGQTRRVSLDLAIPEGLHLALELAIPLGLILTELLTNSLKYAFPEDGAGTVTVRAYAAEGLLRVRALDSGVGLPPGDWRLRPEGMGTQLVRQLAQQVRGSVTRLPGPGTGFEICLPYQDDDLD